jgi:hypothetical protein
MIRVDSATFFRLRLWDDSKLCIKVRYCDGLLAGDHVNDQMARSRGCAKSAGKSHLDLLLLSTASSAPRLKQTSVITQAARRERVPFCRVGVKELDQERLALVLCVVQHVAREARDKVHNDDEAARRRKRESEGRKKTATAEAHVLYGSSSVKFSCTSQGCQYCNGSMRCSGARDRGRRTALSNGEKATGGEEKARSLASQEDTIAVGVRYVGAGVDDVMRDGVGGGAGARCMRTNTNGRQMMCDCIEGIKIQSAPHAGTHRS